MAIDQQTEKFLERLGIEYSESVEKATIAEMLGWAGEEDPTGGFDGLLNQLLTSWNRLRVPLGIDFLETVELEDLIGSSLELLDEGGEDWKASLSDVLGVESENLLNSSGALKEVLLHSLIRKVEIKYDELHPDTADDKDEEIEDEDISYDADILVKQVRYLLTDILDGSLILDPPWQRGDVWSAPMKNKLIISLITEVPIPNIIMISAEKSAQMYMLDGKQRMSAIRDYCWGNFKLPSTATLLPDLESPKGFNYKDCRNKRWKQLPPEAQKLIVEAKIPVIMISSMPNKKTYNLFDRYNSSGKRLSPVELRNATYHDLEFHKAMFELAGETGYEPAGVMDNPILQQLTMTELRSIKQGTRFETMDFVEKYFAYSRPEKSTDQFKPTSASRAIKLFYENNIENEELDVVKALDEICNGLKYASQIFELPYQARRNKEEGRSDLIKSETRSRMSIFIGFIAYVAGFSLDEEPRKQFIEHLKEWAATNEKDTAFDLPANEDATTMWNYQAKWVISIHSSLKHFDKETGCNTVDAVMSEPVCDRMINEMYVLMAE